MMKNLIFSKKYGGTITVSDTDAQLFVTNAGITNVTQANALNTLTIDLKAYNLWNDSVAIYPILGGTSVTHKFNLKDPRNLDIANRLAFSGGIIHAATGMKGNGVDGTANTFLNPRTTLPANSMHISVFNRTDIIEIKNIIGVSDGAGAGYLPIISIALKYASSGSNTGFRAFDFSSHEIVRNIVSPVGLVSGCVLNSTSESMYMNGVKLGSTVTAVQTQLQPNYPIHLLSRNDAGTSANFASNEIAFACIGKGFTDTQIANLYSIVQSYQTSLGR